MKQVNRVVVFGDSLLDGGNLIKTLDIPGEPYTWVVGFQMV